MLKEVYKSDLFITNVKGEKDGKNYDFCVLECVIDDIRIKLFASDKLASQLIKKALPTLEKVEE